MGLDEVRARIALGVPSILIEGDDDQPAYVGSGALIRLGGQEFLLTAGHNVWNKRRNRLAAISVLLLPKGVPFSAGPGDGSAYRATVPRPAAGSDPDPDVAVVELSDRALLRSDREPFEDDELGFLAPSAPRQQLVLGGFPNQMLAVGTHMELKELAGFGRRLPIDMRPLALVVHSLPNQRSPFEPAEGRGVHVGIARAGIDDKRGGVPCEVPPPDGMSGGPLVVPERRGILVGLARSRDDFHDGYDEWCEPVVEAVRLLLEHEDRAVAAAARRIVDRCAAAARA